MKFISRVFLLSVFSTFSMVTEFNKGSYKVEWKLIEPCPEYKHVNLPSPFYGTWRKVNRTHFGFSGNLTLNAIIDAEASVRMVFKKWSDGGWRTFTNLTKPNPCKMITEHFLDLFSEVISAANKPLVCPYPEGVYVWKNYIPKESSMKINFLIGEFDARLYFIKHDVLQYCIHTLFKIIQIYSY